MNDVRTRRTGWCCALAACALVALAMGCSDDNRTPTKAESQAANAKRMDYIDKMNIPDSQKAMMKSHLGGPAVISPMDAARNRAAGGAARPGP